MDIVEIYFVRPGRDARRQGSPQSTLPKGTRPVSFSLSRALSYTQNIPTDKEALLYRSVGRYARDRALVSPSPDLSPSRQGQPGVARQAKRGELAHAHTRAHTHPPLRFCLSLVSFFFLSSFLSISFRSGDSNQLGLGRALGCAAVECSAHGGYCLVRVPARETRGHMYKNQSRQRERPDMGTGGELCRVCRPVSWACVIFPSGWLCGPPPALSLFRFLLERPAWRGTMGFKRGWRRMETVERVGSNAVQDLHPHHHRAQRSSSWCESWRAPPPGESFGRSRGAVWATKPRGGASRLNAKSERQRQRHAAAADGEPAEQRDRQRERERETWDREGEGDRAQLGKNKTTT